jgi:hypothetical protein
LAHVEASSQQEARRTTSNIRFQLFAAGMGDDGGDDDDNDPDEAHERTRHTPAPPKTMLTTN